MTLIAIKCGGTIDKFIGDAVMVFFGDPETLGDEQDAIRCVDMALKMKNRVNELRDFWNRNGVRGGLNVRMGIATGYCTVGNFGSDQRMDYTALGSPVNLSARLQSIAPINEIILSDNTYNLINTKIKSEKISQSTKYGQISEEFFPLEQSYPYNSQNFKFLGDPIDGIQFNENEIILIEFKTNKSQLSQKQRIIRDLIK